MSKGKGLDLGVIVHVLRIPEEASQELSKLCVCTVCKAREDLLT